MATMQTQAAAKTQRRANETAPYWERFAQLEKRAAGPAWLRVARKAGIAHFAGRGFPTLQDEDWRFTNIAAITRLPFKPVIHALRHDVTAKSLKHLPFAGLLGTRLVFINGHFAADLSTVASLPSGVKAMSLAAALDSDTALVAQHLFKHARAEGNAFAALNHAFFQDGAFVYVPAGQTVPEPIQLLHIATAKAEGTTTHLRHLIVAEADSRATVIENFVSLGAASYVTNTVTEWVAGARACVEHVKMQDESPRGYHLATLAAHFGTASNVVTHSIALGAQLSRSTIHAELAGDGVECILNGLYLTRGEQLADHHMVVDHASPQGASHEYFNGILTDHSKGVFHGRIRVRAGAQKTDAKQTNKNLLLSDYATINTKPQLEIHADDVKCTHGATVGQLDEEAIFYLRSRALGADTARQMLIHAFAGEIIDRVRCPPLRAELDQLVWERLEQIARLAAPAPAIPSHV